MACFILRISNNKKQLFLLALNDGLMEFKCQMYIFHFIKQIQSSSERSLAKKSTKTSFNQTRNTQHMKTIESTIETLEEDKHN